jgi:hypothetical protein
MATGIGSSTVISDTLDPTAIGYRALLKFIVGVVPQSRLGSMPFK